MLPESLLAAIERETASWSLSALRSAARALSEAYEVADRGKAAPRLSDVHYAAYALMRMPGTAAALGRVLEALQRRLPGFEPQSVLDLGAGPGTTAWLVRDRYPRLSRITLVERDRGFVALGQRMLADARVRWTAADLRGTRDPGTHDLVVMSYMLGELEPAALDAAVRTAWRSTGAVLLLVEPGTPAGYRRVLGARAEILGAGGFMVAPCPHGGECPMIAPEWCHFAVRLPRSRAQRLAKGGALGWEDEKFSYAVFSPAPVEPAHGRLVGHPRRGTGRVTLRVCGRGGLETRLVTRRASDQYHAARHAEWGDEWPMHLPLGQDAL